MTNPRSRRAFVEALLAQDQDVGPEQYAAYRRALDAQLAAVAARRRLRRRVAWAAVLTVAAAAGMLALVWRPDRSVAPPAPAPAEERLVMLRNAPPAEPLARFEFEATADVIATAVMGEPFERDQENLIRLRVDRVLKGDVPTGRAAVGAAVFCCPSHAMPAAPEPHPPDAKVLVYLSGSAEAGWTLLHLRMQGERFAEDELPQILRCVAVGKARQSADPNREYRRLLGPEQGGLDAAACTTLTCRPDPQAADVLLEHLQQVRARLDAAAGDNPRDERIGEFHRLARLLAQVHEARAVGPVIACLRQLPPGRRGESYACLPPLCRSAGEASRSQARAVLIDEIRAPAAHADDYAGAVAALGLLADRAALEVLLAEQAKRPVSVRHRQLVSAVRDAARALGDAGRDQAREAWLAILDSYRAAPAPTAAEYQAFVRAVVEAIGEEGLSPQQRRRLRTIRDRHQAGWFRQELDRLGEV